MVNKVDFSKPIELYNPSMNKVSPKVVKWLGKPYDKDIIVTTESKTYLWDGIKIAGWDGWIVRNKVVREERWESVCMQSSIHTGIMYGVHPSKHGCDLYYGIINCPYPRVGYFKTTLEDSEVVSREFIPV